MRIGIFTSSLPEPDRKPGGVDVFVDELANRLAWRGHAVTMFSYSSAPYGSAYGSVRLSPARYAHGKLARMTLVPLALNRLEAAELDILHLHGDDWFFISRRVPTVRTFHGSARHEARTATGMKRQVGQAVTFGLEIVASRLATASYMGAPPEESAYRPAGVLPYAVDVPSDAKTTRTGAPSVLFVGTFGGRKRGNLLYEAFQRDVLPHLPNAELHMVSDECPSGPNVTWWERPDNAQLHELYRRAWVFCLPSSYEGFGLPYVEAMAAGTPVVATANPGAEYVLAGGRYGVIATEEQLGRQLAELLTDEARRSRLACAGRERVQEFSWKAATDAHQRAYEEAITAWSARRRLTRRTWSAPLSAG